jgi:serine protease Do
VELAVARVCFLVLALLALGFPAFAQSGARPLGYAQAEQAFDELRIEERVKLQVILTAAGYWNAVPTGTFSKRLFEAIARFQNENGFAPSGRLGEKQFERLLEISAPKLALWGLREISHPERRRSIWVPVGLGMHGERTRYGLSFREPQDRLRLSFNYYPGTDLRAAFAHLVTKFQSEGTFIHYKVLRADFFAISSTSAAGVDGYLRYHDDGTGILGFSMFWDNAKGVVNAERVAVLTSASLWAAMTGAAFTTPPVIRRPDLEVARPLPAPNPPTASLPTTPPAPAPPRASETPSFSSGTGFFVNRQGHVLTNDHVVGECSAVAVLRERGESAIGRVIARDPANDLAVVQADLKPSKVAAFRIGSRLGEPVAVFGYPLSDVLASSGNFTLGNITALAGMRDDSRYVQISAPVQAGNSGGPLLDHSGNYIGVVTAKLNALKVAERAGDLPQNVNFALKGSVAANFLDTNGIAFEVGTSNADMAPANLAEHAKAVTAFVLCKK